MPVTQKIPKLGLGNVYLKVVVRATRLDVVRGSVTDYY